MIILDELRLSLSLHVLMSQVLLLAILVQLVQFLWQVIIGIDWIVSNHAHHLLHQPYSLLIDLDLLPLLFSLHCRLRQLLVQAHILLFL